MSDGPTLDRDTELAAHAAQFLIFEKEFAEPHEAAAARVTTRHTLQGIAEDMGFAPDEIEAAVDAALKAATTKEAVTT